AAKLLEQPALVVERQIEMMNVFLGFEQANKYVLMDPAGQHVGYMAEEDLGMMGTLQRQAFRTHRAFKAHVLDREGREVLTIQRPFSYINSKIKVFTDPGLSDSTLIGESQQHWHLTRRKYNLFHNRSGTMEQFALINEPMLSWDFSLVDESGGLVGSVNRNFAGFARELFTDTGNYVLRMDASSHQTTSGGALVPVNENGLTLDQRAVMLATAVSIDFDYFSKLSGHGGGM
ncbi:Scramblase, partial [Saitoella complicata NRRL Y-17804]|uniref:Scramblase n=1 Tax=Saitoella complicata (strain BCRC 22490 / CBS 7301 / JCM 7358 / NBRC 10748 / NRRL Y-17804) TaxID=698492 RepID=UPI00086826BB